MSPTKLQRTAAVHLLHLGKIGLSGDQHTGDLTVHEVLLKYFGTVFKGVRVTDVIDQADHVTGQISISQVIEVRKHFMKKKIFLLSINIGCADGIV